MAVNAQRQAEIEFLKDLVAKDPNLGKVKDQDIGDKYGVSKSLVWRVRMDLGIDAHRGRSHTQSEKYKTLQDRIIAEGTLGKYPDYILADNYQCSRYFVQKLRSKLGIAPCNPQRLQLSPEQLRPPNPLMPLLENWPCIKERVGLTRNQWRTHVQSLR